MPEKQDWQEWDEERKGFKHRDTEGFTKDLAALEAHIRALREVCPKDNAGFPIFTAMVHLDRLTKEYHRFIDYLALHGR